MNKCLTYLNPTLKLSVQQEEDMCRYFFNVDRCTNYLQRSILSIFANVLYIDRYADCQNTLARCKSFITDVLNGTADKSVHRTFVEYVFDCILGLGAYNHALTTCNKNYACMDGELYLEDFTPTPINVYTSIVSVVFGQHSGINNPSIFQVSLNAVTHSLLEYMRSIGNMYTELQSKKSTAEKIKKWLLYNIILQMNSISSESLLAYIILCGYNYNQVLIPFVSSEVVCKQVVGDSKWLYKIQPAGIDISWGEYDISIDEDVLMNLTTPKMLPEKDAQSAPIAEEADAKINATLEQLKELEDTIDPELLRKCGGDTYKAILLSQMLGGKSDDKGNV